MAGSMSLDSALAAPPRRAAAQPFTFGQISGGTHAQLLKRDGLYADMWLRQLAEDAEVQEAAE